MYAPQSKLWTFFTRRNVGGGIKPQTSSRPNQVGIKTDHGQLKVNVLCANFL